MKRQMNACHIFAAASIAFHSSLKKDLTRSDDPQDSARPAAGAVKSPAVAGLFGLFAALILVQHGWTAPDLSERTLRLRRPKRDEDRVVEIEQDRARQFHVCHPSRAGEQ
jgi:hypothetical protein